MIKYRVRFGRDLEGTALGDCYLRVKEVQFGRGADLAGTKRDNSVGPSPKDGCNLLEHLGF
jgi:hypothetical protein